MFPRKILLLAALGSAGPALAQRTAIAPLAPVAPVVAAPPLGLPLGFDTASQLYAQPAAPVPDQPARVVRPQPVFLVDSRTIVGGGLTQLKPKDIASISVYRGANAPAKWRSLTENGIIAITLLPHLKPKLKTTSLASIARGLKLRGPISYQLDGLPLEDLTLRVATADIAGLTTQPTAGGTIINIRLAMPPPVVHPPGTILIRGVSRL